MNNEIMIEVSARHVHLSKQDLEVLFGKDYKLTKRKDLSQPGQFACVEKVRIVTERGELKASILAPLRNRTQVEIALADARFLGLEVPIRESGDISGSGSCTLIGPAGGILLKEGVIAAKRHIHMTPQDAQTFNVKDKEKVALAVETNDRSAILKDVIVRVSADFATAVHIDTDEANAMGVEGTIYGKFLSES